MVARFGTCWWGGRRVTTSSAAGGQGIQALPPDLAAAGHSIDKELRRKPRKVMTMTADAGDALAEAHAEFLGDLGREAIRLARKDGLRTVDRVHVEQAAGRLGTGSSESKVGTAFSTMGGLLGGIGLAAAWNLAFGSGLHSTGEQIATIAVCVVGFVLLAVGLTLTVVGRR